MPASPGGYRLCGPCAERQGAAGWGSAGPGECYVCGGLMDGVEETAAKVTRAVRRYEFRTFGVGLSMPEGVQEREDELRADLKLKGSETVRVQAARLISAAVAKALRKKVDRGAPDLTAVVDLASGSVAVNSRSAVFYGRYTKPAGVSQKREPCGSCGGRGCDACAGTGLGKEPSVEEALRRRLARACGSDRMRITWLGSEDSLSRVLPPGRPFVAEVKNPVRRKIPRAFVVRTGGGTVRVSRGKLLPGRPSALPSFRFRTLIRAVAAQPPADADVAGLARAFRKAEVRFDRPHDRPTTKKVYSARGKRRGRSLTIDAVLDGGLPVKRFVSGELVSPSVSEVLKTEVRCRTFDILEVEETGEFGFGKVTRL